jgi:hypothetical protein
MPSEDMDRRSRKSCGAGEIYRVASFKSLADAEQLCDTSPTTGRPGGRTWQAINIPDPPKIRTMFSPLKWCVNGVGRVWDEAFLPLTRRKPCPFFTSILWPVFCHTARFFCQRQISFCGCLCHRAIGRPATPFF